MAFTYTNDLSAKTYAAGGRQPEFKLVGSLQRIQRTPGIEEGYCASFASGGAEMAQQGRTTIVRIKNPGQERFAFLLRAWDFRQVEGHTPKVWKVSSAKCEAGLLLVASVGFQLEVAAYKGKLRCLEVQADGSFMEVDQAVVAL